MKTHYLALGAFVLLGGMAYGVDLGPGRAAFDRGEYEEAYNQFSAAFREDPSDLEANLALGEAAYMNKKYSHAVFAFERVLMAEPDHEKALLGMALALQALGRTEEALEAFAAVGATTKDNAIYGEAIAELEAALKKGESRFSAITEVSIAAVYDDNVNYGTDNNLLLPGGASKETAGIEGSVDVYGTYDVGARNNWVLIGGLGLFNSWYDVAPEQEVANVRGYTGVRRIGKESMVELAGRAERLWYGHSALVDLFAADAAYLRSVSSSDWLKTALTVEQRNFDKDFDPAGSRDSVYVSLGQSWNHCFGGSRNNYIGLGGDLFCEDAKSGSDTYRGFRLRLDGQVELPGAVLAYAGGRYRMADYDDPDLFSTTEREDDRWDLVVGVKKSVSERLMLDLQAMHIRNDSNSAAYDYERNRVSLTATFKF
ncbi:MAG: tetratricopeptide repeat protein [Lentisphaerae bacterium]|nr:tetratricopeptide repeat protein [Lentisphaerota bacterium]